MHFNTVNWAFNAANQYAASLKATRQTFSINPVSLTLLPTTAPGYIDPSTGIPMYVYNKQNRLLLFPLCREGTRVFHTAGGDRWMTYYRRDRGFSTRV